MSQTYVEKYMKALTLIGKRNKQLYNKLIAYKNKNHIYDNVIIPNKYPDTRFLWLVFNDNYKLRVLFTINDNIKATLYMDDKDVSEKIFDNDKDLIIHINVTAIRIKHNLL